MQVRWSFWFTLLFMLFLGGCSADDDDSSDTDDDETSDDDTAGDDIAVDDDAADDDAVDPFLHPEEKGPYLVGNTTYFFEDASRELSCGEGSRWLMTEVWYPAADNAAEWPENWMHDFWLDRLDEVEQALENAGINPDDAMIDMATGSYRDAPVHPDAPAMPIIVFSHGFSSNRFQNFTMADYLASHGYVVVAPDHICNSIVTLTPTEAVMMSPLDFFLTLGERKEDVSFLIDVFTENPPELLAGRLDNERIGFWGHSWGGVTVTEEIKVDRRAKALLQMTAFGFPTVPEDLEVPSMYFTGQEDKLMYIFRPLHDKLIDLMPRPKYELSFFDTGHFAFSDLCLFAATIAENGNGCGTETRIRSDELFTNPTHDALHAVLNPYAIAFFGAALFDSPELWEYLAENHFPEMMDYIPEL